ncbi:MAG: hypothetical protein MZV70_02850 [Desulfobacterales bacterium]|nr:hypothetical protein [Desulfobacterales bacterium]
MRVDQRDVSERHPARRRSPCRCRRTSDVVGLRALRVRLSAAGVALLDADRVTGRRRDPALRGPLYATTSMRAQKAARLV